jgi:small basic protein
MQLFKSYTYAWWQVDVFKLALLSIGALIGATWHEFLTGNAAPLAAIAVAATAYTVFVSLRQAQLP